MEIVIVSYKTIVTLLSVVLPALLIASIWYKWKKSVQYFIAVIMVIVLFLLSMIRIDGTNTHERVIRQTMDISTTKVLPDLKVAEDFRINNVREIINEDLK